MRLSYVMSWLTTSDRRMHDTSLYAAGRTIGTSGIAPAGVEKTWGEGGWLAGGVVLCCGVVLRGGASVARVRRAGDKADHDRRDGDGKGDGGDGVVWEQHGDVRAATAVRSGGAAAVNSR